VACRFWGCRTSGAAREYLDLLTHPSPKEASDPYTRVGVIWPRPCRVVPAVQLPRPEDAYTRDVHPEPLRPKSGGPISPTFGEKMGPGYWRAVQDSNLWPSAPEADFTNSQCPHPLPTARSRT
jgi:hypothetical protein